MHDQPASVHAINPTGELGKYTSREDISHAQSTCQRTSVNILNNRFYIDDNLLNMARKGKTLVFVN